MMNDKQCANKEERYKFYRAKATCGCCTSQVSGQLHYDFNSKITTKGEIIDILLQEKQIFENIKYLNIIETIIKNKIVIFINDIENCLCGHAYYIYEMFNTTMETDYRFIQTGEIPYLHQQVFEFHIETLLQNSSYNYKKMYDNMWKENGIGHGLSEHFGHPNKLNFLS
jgi:hypothetical protein